MLRPAVVWTLFVLCALGVIAALGLLTQHARALELAGRRAAADADLADRTRFALWRMDTAASSILAVENNRSPTQFAAITSRNASQNPTLSPLLRETPDYALLHFELRETNVWSSPQVPKSLDFPQVLQSGIPQTRLTESAARLERLRAHIPAASLFALLKEQGNDAESRDQQAPGIAVSAPAKSEMNSVPAAFQNEETVDLLTKDYAQRSAVVENATRQGEVARAGKVGTKAKPESKMRKKQEDTGGLADSVPGAAEKVLPEERPSPKENAPLTQAFAAKTSSNPAEFSPYEAVWIEGELLLCRTVHQGAQKWIQGVWLDAAALSVSLLATAREILPGASLIASQPGQAGPLSLVTLPYVLQPGEPPALDATRLPRPVQGFLTLAWGASLLMLVVAGVLLAGVLQLGERRAAFVSSVTHELRTPLTTFRLYAEMLAEKMIPEEEKRQQYLRTLQTESARLCHLVENVLAYSRIERGSAKAKVEQLSVVNLLDRIVPRLEERATTAALGFTTSCPAEIGSLVLQTDATAIEQILFNLTDNACKYAAPGALQATLELSVVQRGKEILFSLRDYGPGISRKELRKLFRPFHKSATEAAHSQPGVGLGLALSRRLARALGGDLRYESARPGARFALGLPL